MDFSPVQASMTQYPFLTSTITPPQQSTTQVVEPSNASANANDNDKDNDNNSDTSSGSMRDYDYLGTLVDMRI